MTSLLRTTKALLVIVPIMFIAFQTGKGVSGAYLFAYATYILVLFTMHHLLKGDFYFPPSKTVINLPSKKSGFGICGP